VNCVQTKISNRRVVWVLALLAGFAVCKPVNAAIVEVLDYDLTANPASGSGTLADPFTYSVTGPTSGDTFEIQMYGFSTAGGLQAVEGDDPFAAATVVNVANTADEAMGLGVCSAIESDPALSDCTSDAKSRSMTSTNTMNEIDWVLVIFSEDVDVNSFELTPEGDKDRNVTYYTGRINDYTDLEGDTPNLLEGFINGQGWNPAIVRDDLGKGKKAKKGQPFIPRAIEVDASGHQYHVNALLIGAYQEVTVEGKGKKAKTVVTGSTEVTLTNVTVSTVPIPAAVWLFGSALGALFYGRRLNMKAAKES
jgi:hypothetical protein